MYPGDIYGKKGIGKVKDYHNIHDAADLVSRIDSICSIFGIL